MEAGSQISEIGSYQLLPTCSITLHNFGSVFTLAAWTSTMNGCLIHLISLTSPFCRYSHKPHPGNYGHLPRKRDKVSGRLLQEFLFFGCPAYFKGRQLLLLS